MEKAHRSTVDTEHGAGAAPSGALVIEYANEKAAGVYGGTEAQHRRFTSKLALNGLVEWPIRLRDVP